MCNCRSEGTLINVPTPKTNGGGDEATINVSLFWIILR